MKCKHTKNGNVKLTMTLEQAEHLKTIINNSHFLDYHDGIDKYSKEEVEASSWEAFEAFKNAGIQGD